MEYHSKSGTESEIGQFTLSNTEQRNSFLHVQFPMPYTFPKPYLTLNEVELMLDDTLPHVQNKNIAKDPDEALSYIINHFNINTVSQSIRKFPEITFKQVYYSTYIDTSRYTGLQRLIDLTAKNLRNRNALAQQWLQYTKNTSDIHCLMTSHPIYCNVYYSSNSLLHTFNEHMFTKETHTTKPHEPSVQSREHQLTTIFLYITQHNQRQFVHPLGSAGHHVVRSSRLRS